ncbi:uncharacterized protein [Asterias amurensis]|uniref:uncharacterized protein n=1 Tax=Asterias amurensis TaxID=7602 RepID=UPI003AB7F56F
MAYVETSSTQQAAEILEDETLAEEELLDELENEEIPAHIREARMGELKSELQRMNEHQRKGYGTYSELKKEKELLDLTTQENKVIIHFFHSDFKLCAVIDKHLKVLAEKHFGTKFARISVTVAQFCVQKLHIKVLPAVLIFIDAKEKDRIVGFEDLGNQNDFRTEVLENRLAKSGVIQLFNAPIEPFEKKTLLGYERRKPDEESDDDDY